MTTTILSDTLSHPGTVDQIKQLQSDSTISAPATSIMAPAPAPLSPGSATSPVSLLKRNPPVDPAVDALSTPESKSIPLSPASGASGGALTPRANKATIELPADGKTTELTSDMNGLKVQSPTVALSHQPPASIDQMIKAEPQRSVHDRSFSSSTDSSSSGYHPAPPSHLGSSYGSEGFPVSADFTEDGFQLSSTPMDLHMSAQAAAAIARADEAIKQLNGTSSVIQGMTTNGVPSVENSYTLPRGYADFVKPRSRTRHRSPEFNAHRQSSTSSSTTEASTSSEESDLCIPSIEWVNLPNSAVSPYHSPYNFGSMAQQQQKATRSPGRMPPPPLRSIHSPRRASADRPGLPGHQPSLPLGATAHSPGGLRSGSSALPGGVLPDDSAEDDDDQATVGNGRERSPSTSSQSAQSGLDLLWRAAHHTSESPVGDSPYNHPYDSKGKRKAGAEAVAQWRNSGIPTGTANTTKSNGNGSAKAGSGPPKKRRRSEIQMEEIDPALRDEESQYADESALGTDQRSQYDSESEEGVDSNEDPEYQGESKTRARGGARARGAAVAGRRGARAGARVSTGSNAANGTSQAKGAGKKRKGESPNRAAAAAASARRSSGGGGVVAGGVQCEYVNPLPPYNRCLDVFTRKYDLPRHMARHARREGELVVEGKLSEDKALLWKTIKDKPKVSCSQCGESFTRMDALKRHQTKQHHH